MKHTVFFLLIALFTITASAQKDLNAAKSKADLFSEKAGTLIQSETTKIGSLKKLDVKTITITDLISGDKITAIRLETVYSSTIDVETKVGTFDKDEIDAVLKSLAIIKSKLSETPAADAEYTEISYTSRAGVEVGCFTSPKKFTWNLYLKLEKYDGNSYVFLDKDNIDDLITLMQQAKDKL